MDSSAKMESLSSFGSGAAGRKETWSLEQRQDGAREAGGAHTGAKRPKETERQPGATQGNKSCVRRTQINKQECARFGPESWGSVFYSEPCL